MRFLPTTLSNFLQLSVLGGECAFRRQKGYNWWEHSAEGEYNALAHYVNALTHASARRRASSNPPPDVRLPAKR